MYTDLYKCVFNSRLKVSGETIVCNFIFKLFHNLMYRPPSCTINYFDDVIIKINQLFFSLNSPLPNIIILGDFN